MLVEQNLRKWVRTPPDAKVIIDFFLFFIFSVAIVAAEVDKRE